MIIHLHTGNIDRVWPLVSPALAKALTKTKLGLLWDLPSLLKHLQSGAVLGFYQPETGYCGVYSINECPLGNDLYFFWSGKVGDVPMNLAEVDEYLQVVAKAFGCKTITCEGRKGWKPLIQPLGYAEDSVTFQKEVNYELDSNHAIAPPGDGL